jgi:hypothetical protein
MRVIASLVDLARTLKSHGHFYNSRQPFQGGLAEFVSSDVKCNYENFYPDLITGLSCLPIF